MKFTSRLSTLFNKTRVNIFKDEKILFRGRSKYRLLTVVENPKNNTRALYASNHLFVAGINTKTRFPLHSPYFLADIFVPKPQSALFLGGGPNAVPTYVWKKYKPKLIHVVERDNLTTLLAKKYFNLPNDKNYKIFHTDAKAFLNETQYKYDIIYFNLGLTRKRGINKNDLFPLCSYSGILNLSNHLSKKGVLIYILISKLQGKGGLFMKKCLVSFNKIFPTAYVFSDFQHKTQKTQSVTFLCLKYKADIGMCYRKLLKLHLLTHERQIYDNLLSRIHKRKWSTSNLKPFI